MSFTSNRLQIVVQDAALGEYFLASVWNRGQSVHLEEFGQLLILRSCFLRLKGQRVISMSSSSTIVVSLDPPLHFTQSKCRHLRTGTREAGFTFVQFYIKLSSSFSFGLTSLLRRTFKPMLCSGEGYSEPHIETQTQLGACPGLCSASGGQHWAEHGERTQKHPVYTYRGIILP